MTIEELLKEARSTWGDTTMSLEQMIVALGVVYGDICRQARSGQEGKQLDEIEVQKELGNLIFSSIRWCQELGYNPETCIGLAKRAQQEYVAKRKATH